jgi:tripartite-type tricarboxylate transporter receptor subunit TctC
MNRRVFLSSATAALAVGLPALSRIARAQSYPTRPVRIVVGFAPSGAQDVLARLIGQWLSERFDQRFFIDNRPGGGGNVGAETVVNSPPDGYTLLLVGPPNMINASLYERLNFNFIRDIAPVASVYRVPLVMEVHPSFPAKTVSEFISFAKANPGKINMASAGIGTAHHVAGELFKMMAGVDMVHVPYRGEGPALGDLIGGQVQVMFGVMASSIPHIRAGTVRALAVTTAMRSEALRDVPTLAEFVPGYEASSLFGIGAPKNSPADIVDRLNREIDAALADSKMRARLADLGGIMLAGSPADFGKLIAEETEKWAKVVKFSGAKPE